MESPRPVPFPVGLVVKKGSNNLFFTSSVNPVPLSLIEMITVSFFEDVDTVRLAYCLIRIDTISSRLLV